jgi:hypothetical protein
MVESERVTELVHRLLHGTRALPRRIIGLPQARKRDYRRQPLAVQICSRQICLIPPLAN